MSVAAALAGGLVSSAAQLYANQQNIKANDERFGAEVELANTAHRREVEDLKAAGLNPILSASGSGAAVPQLGAAQVDSIGDKLGDSIQSAGRLASLEIPLKDSQINLNSAHAEAMRLSNEDSWHKLANDSIDDWARFEAMTGTRVKDVEDFISGDEGREAYHNLVKMYRNQIETGRYQSSLGRAVFDDVRGGISSAADIVGAAKGIKGMLPQKYEENYNIDRFDKHGNRISSETHSRKGRR